MMTSHYDPRMDQVNEARQAGSQARRDGFAASANPHQIPGNREYAAWKNGWLSEDRWIKGGGIEGVKRRSARKRLEEAGAPVGFGDLLSGKM